MKTDGKVPGVVFCISNDGGKTGIYWREDALECLDYLEPHKKELSDYCVVAVRQIKNQPCLVCCREHPGETCSGLPLEE